MIRILKASTISRKYLSYFHTAHPEVWPLDYERHKAVLEYDSYAEVGFWKRYLERSGDYEVMECYIDYEALQQKWAGEQRVAVTSHWLREILAAQIAAFAPDVIFEDDAAHLDPAWRSAIRARFPFIRRFVAWDGYIRSDISRFEGCDLVLTCVEGIRQRYLGRGFRCEILPFGFEPEILQRIPDLKDHQATFVGNIIPEIHTYRLRTLSAIKERLDLDVWISNFSRKLGDWKRRANYYRQAAPGDWAKIHALEKVNHGEAFGLQMYGIFHHSGVTLNIHGDGVAQAGNMRLIETCGSGACLVTDDKPNIRDYLTPDEEIVVFSSIPEAIDKIRNLSKDTALRDSIARKGQQKVLSQFSFADRVARFEAFLQMIL